MSIEQVGGADFFDIEEIDNQDEKVEKVLLGFRCVTGVDLKLFKNSEKNKIDELIEYNKVFIENQRVYNKNFLLADELALFILD